MGPASFAGAVPVLHYHQTTAQQFGASYASPTSTRLWAEHGLVLSERLPPSSPHDGRHRPAFTPQRGDGCLASPHLIEAQQCAASNATPSDRIPARTHEALLAFAPATPAVRLAHDRTHLPPRAPQPPPRRWAELHGSFSLQNSGSLGR